ncbi:MAG: exodeoxyribonuclease V subunit gamma [Gammaproteobacteria bacterium]|nr:exodeoxyribonuclease V subunit gamma [Gammaproteobacteria bacterium]
MLQFFQSNDLSALTSLFCERSQVVDTDPFTARTVIVQSHGTGQWLKLQLAETQGISANLDCKLPADYIWSLYRDLLGQAKQSPMDKELLTWRVMSILPEQRDPEFDSIRRYLDVPGDRDLRTFQLANEIAGLFDQYLVYRPEWLLAWESNNTLITSSAHPWQMRLWLSLLQVYPELRDQHRARLHLSLLKQLEALARPDRLPGHISLFGLSSLPQMHLDTFRALSAHLDVDIYFMNPCCHYWGDIVSAKDNAKRSIRNLIGKSGQLEDEDYLEVGNPLLAAMGKQGRDFLELILESDEVNSFDAFIPTSVDTALGFMQNDILNLELGGQFGSTDKLKKVKLSNEDSSIQLHSCHSKLREVEILYDQLLLLFSANQSIRPADVIVMTPNVADYTPFIHSVFKQHIHYGITDRSIMQQSALVGSFCKLLELPQSRLTSIEVMDFLEVPAIARKFNLGEDELNTIAYWIDAAGIRWEMDGRTKADRWQVPASHQNTWRFGLDRLLLGMAMDTSSGTFAGNFPLDVASGDTELLGRLCFIIRLIGDFRQLLTIPKPAREWQEAVNELLSELFLPLDDETLDLSMIQGLMQKLVDNTHVCDFTGNISGQLIRYWVNQQLALTHSSMGFVSGGITFATLVPMRSIPFKVVCLLGMNDGEYPREDRPTSFDLMSVEGARKGDRSRRLDDRYLFLEAMLSAREVFYVSYEGNARQDNKEKPPSIVVSELLDYTDQVFESVNVTRHPLQPFSRRYFSNANLTSFQKHWYDALQGEGNTTPFVDSDLEIPEELALESVNQLTSFFRHSGKYYLQQRLGVYFSEDEIDLKDSESFTLDGLARYKLSESALQVLVKGESIQDWKDEMVASGLVMDGASGRTQLDRELQHAMGIWDTLAAYLEQAGENFRGSIQLSGTALEGHLDNVGATFVLHYRGGTLRKRQLLEIWIKHLFANAAGRDIETISISRGKGSGGTGQAETGRFLPLPRDEALSHLEYLAGLYNQGLISPLCFPPEASFSFFEAMQKSENITKATDAACRMWNSSEFAEGNDIYWSRLFSLPQDLDDDFIARAQQVYGAMLPHWHN